MGPILSEVTSVLAGILNFALNGGSRIHLVIQNDGHLATNVFLSEAHKAWGSLLRKGEINLPHARIGCTSIFNGAAKVAPSDSRSAVEAIPDLTGIWKSFGGSTLLLDPNKFGSRKQPGSLRTVS